MYPRKKLLDAVRGLDYEFKRRANRVEIYRQNGTGKLISLSVRKQHSPEYCRMILRGAGLDEAGIEAFLGN